MRVCCLGDMHYAGSSRELEEIARRVERVCRGTDAVVVVGDVTASGNLADLGLVVETLVYVAQGRPVLVLPGNHDIYVVAERDGDTDSLRKLELFNRVVREAGAIPLMEEPYVYGGVGFVGSIGWYDYSFAPDWLGLTIDDYRAKAFRGYIWADRDYVRLPFSDEEFTLMLVERLEQQLRSLAGRVDRIVAVLHHLPFRELAVYRFEPSWDYFTTFMGSEAFGYLIERYRGLVSLVLYGHQHNGVSKGECRGVRGVRRCNCASPVPLTVEV